MIDSKSMACYTEIILAKLQKSEEDTMNYKSVKISEELYTDEKKTVTLGLWDAKTRTIWIRRSQLCSIESFAGTLIHECTHAASRCGDVSRAFEAALTENLGRQAAYYLR